VINRSYVVENSVGYSIVKLPDHYLNYIVARRRLFISRIRIHKNISNIIDLSQSSSAAAAVAEHVLLCVLNQCSVFRNGNGKLFMLLVKFLISVINH
jgi:hypothetical protein